jgi:pimeloyl-ACP methyl ester carboxylesterase
MHSMAKEFGGIMYYTEHRYYGKSHPTPDTSTENLKYLTVDQALADLAHFIRRVKKNKPKSGVIVIGASYSATMATWMRLKYPELVDGAWASSAPLYAKMNFYEYNEVMTESVKQVGGTACLSRIENAFKQLEQYVANAEPEVLRKIQKVFNLCEPLDLSRDTEHFFYELSDTISGLVQGHRNDDIQLACDYITRARTSDDVEAFAKWIKATKREKCIDLSYKNAIEKYTNVTWGAEANQQLRQWIFQTCDTFGWFQTGASLNQSFGSLYPQVSYFVKMCSDFYGEDRFDESIIEGSIAKTNEKYGGFHPKATRVYSSHGYVREMTFTC